MGLRGMDVLYGVLIVEGEGLHLLLLGLNLGNPIASNGDFVTWLFPDYFGQFLFTDKLGGLHCRLCHVFPVSQHVSVCVCVCVCVCRRELSRGTAVTGSGRRVTDLLT